MKRALVLALLPLSLLAGDVVYPSGTVTRSYSGSVAGSVAGVTVSALVQAEVTATPEAFLQPSGNVFVVRGRFVQPPLVKDAAELTNWSNLIAVHTSGDYVRAAATWGDGNGAVVASWPVDWSWITVEAVGTVLELPVTLSRSTVTLSATVTNVPAPDVEEPTFKDAVDVNRIRIIGKHGMSPAKADVTRRLYSASKQGSNVRLSFDPLDWPTESTKGKTCDGGVCIVWEEGGELLSAPLVGGWFDHHKVGQVSKTMENIHGGYVDGKQPPAGAQVWFYIISYNGRQRTTIVPGWKW